MRCVKSPPAARGFQEAGFNEDSLAKPFAEPGKGVVPRLREFSAWLLLSKQAHFVTDLCLYRKICRLRHDAFWGT